MSSDNSQVLGTVGQASVSRRCLSRRPWSSHGHWSFKLEMYSSYRRFAQINNKMLGSPTPPRRARRTNRQKGPARKDKGSDRFAVHAPRRRHSRRRCPSPQGTRRGAVHFRQGGSVRRQTLSRQDQRHACEAQKVRTRRSSIPPCRVRRVPLLFIVLFSRGDHDTYSFGRSPRTARLGLTN